MGYVKPAPHFRVFTSDGTPSDLKTVIERMASADAVFIGETHDDPVAHQLELYLLIEGAVQARQAGRGSVLSLEMFESDVQPQLDEYRKGLIRERDLMMDARPWSNYRSDYRLLVEFAKASNMHVIAANAPRRYIAAVAKDGKQALDSFPDSAQGYLCPLPLPEPSAAYVRHFNEEMLPAQHGESPAALGSSASQPSEEGCPYIGFKGNDPKVLDPIIMWDATMAHRIASTLDDEAGAMVYHVCGSFHCQKHLGIVEMLQGYRAGCRSLVVSVYSEEDFLEFNAEEHGGKGDFVILTDTNAKAKANARANAAEQENPLPEETKEQ